MSGRLPGRIRIVSGAKRGLWLRVPPGSGVRPTSEMVREAIFNALGPIPQAQVLDLFAGTGALGLEALSRGAGRCVFVEVERAVAEVLKANIKRLEYERQARVMVGDYRAAVQMLINQGERFDLLFVDPPYRMLSEVEATLLPWVPSLLSVDGLVVIEGSKSLGTTFGLEVVFDRVYGDTRVTMVSARKETA
mgnify:CR=1 FL=1